MVLVRDLRSRSPGRCWIMFPLSRVDHLIFNFTSFYFSRMLYPYLEAGCFTNYTSVTSALEMSGRHKRTHRKGSMVIYELRHAI